MEKDDNDIIDKLPGVGPATAEKLRDAGYIDIMSIAVASPKELSDAAEIGEASGSKIILQARKQADIGDFETGSALLEKRAKVCHLTSGYPSFRAFGLLNFPGRLSSSTQYPSAGTLCLTSSTCMVYPLKSRKTPSFTSCDFILKEGLK